MYNANNEEQEILKFWDKDDTFKKSVAKDAPKGPYVFYDGPPFATGLPHYGHILASVIKDVVPRYFTMKGYNVRRRWGWDCHGLPIESLIEKELNISGKKDIEDELGVDKFNEACRSKVLMYTGEWKKMVERIGRWVEFDNSYKTMDPTYMESVWWALKTIWDKNLIYEGRKVLMYCPHCETPVSKAEIAMDNSYKDITEESATAKFKVKKPEQHDLPENTFILAWTTTPWTLPGNVALAVGEKIIYCLVDSGGENFVVAEDLVEKVFVDKEKKVVKNLVGHDLVGIEYEPLFDMPEMLATSKKAYYVAEADFVTTADGTGVVHTAVIYGEDDYNLGLKLDLPMVPMLNEKGEFNETAPEALRGKYFKQAEKEIKKHLDARGLLFAKLQYTHSYPHCWRCDTPLIYNAISAWFINIQKVKPRLIELNEKINWYPDHLKHGRFKNILETAPDWNISRNRYWATPLPFWKCGTADCKNVVCVGSVNELKEQALNFSDVYSNDKVEEMDLHKHVVDKIKLKCSDCGGSMDRIPEVIDCWVESGSMPFAEFHYPFENKDVFKNRFPGQYIAEYINQTRAWFYYMHAMAGLLFDSNSFENCVTTGEVQNEKGEKLSKSKKNYPDPWIIIEKYGVDTLRYYMMTSPVMEAENLLFNEREIKDVYNKVINILWNVVEFYLMYAGESGKIKVESGRSVNVLDKWILAKMQVLIKEVTVNMDSYNTVRAGRPIRDFIDELSTWYLRRSRDRFKNDDVEDKQNALHTLKIVLVELSKIMAPFMPFVSEKIFKAVAQSSSSVHLEMWSIVEEKYVDAGILDEMSLARKVVEFGLAARAEAKMRIRQPLQAVGIKGAEVSVELQKIIADELNVKEVVLGKVFDVKKEDNNLLVSLDTVLTPELKKEGLAREVVRTINQMRKELGFTIQDRAVVEYATDDADLAAVFTDCSEEIKRQTLTDKIVSGGDGREVELDGKKVKLSVNKV